MSDATLFERIIANAQTAATSLRVKSALNPMLWMCAIVTPACLTLAYFAYGKEPLETILLLLGAAPIFATILGFLYFMIFRPEKLQSEDYQIRHETLELIKEKGASVAVVPSSLDAITNPVRAVLPASSGGHS